MTKSRWSLCVIGAWITGSLFVTMVATQNFYTIDRLLTESQNTDFRSLVAELGHDRARDLLRYLSSELNRLYFFWWNVAQLVLGSAVLLLTVRMPHARRVRALVAAMLLVVIVMLAWMTPEITAIGRRLDFVPRNPAPPEMSRFWMLHAGYTMLEIGKLVAASVVAMMLARETTTTLQQVS